MIFLIKRIGISIAIIAIVLLSGREAAFAQQSTGSVEMNLIDTIIQKFGLKKTDVQNVVNEFQKQKQEAALNAMSDRLNALVGEGKISQNQKQQLFEKWRSMTLSHMQSNNDLRQWMLDNKIDPTIIKFGTRNLRGLHHRGMGNW